jgi:hypothetical protein
MAIRMSTNEKKSIKFDIAIAGTDISELKGKLKIKYVPSPNISEGEVKTIATINNIEYGLPIIINTDKTIEAEIPPLDEFIKKDLVDGSVLKAKLEIVAGDTYMVPWKDTINIEVPVAVEATVTETTTIDEKEKMSISVKNILETSTVTKKEEEPKKVIKVKPKTKFGKTLEG